VLLIFLGQTDQHLLMGGALMNNERILKDEIKARYGQAALQVRIMKSTLSSDQLPALCTATNEVGETTLEDEGASWLISIIGLC
jgi:hypothetical protein